MNIIWFYFLGVRNWWWWCSFAISPKEGHRSDYLHMATKGRQELAAYFWYHIKTYYPWHSSWERTSNEIPREKSHLALKNFRLYDRFYDRWYDIYVYQFYSVQHFQFSICIYVLNVSNFIYDETSGVWQIFDGTNFIHVTIMLNKSLNSY